MSLTGNILAALEQANLLDELKAVSFPAGAASVMYDNMENIATFDTSKLNNE